jgi:hypothetical protein
VLDPGGQARSRLLLGLVCLALASCDLGDDGSRMVLLRNQTAFLNTWRSTRPSTASRYCPDASLGLVRHRCRIGKCGRCFSSSMVSGCGETLVLPLPTAKTALSSGHGWALAGHRFTLRVVATRRFAGE